eukprot:TRINITY_DN14383_c0_g1_i1.p2 TRINITY_DN14383_c0_g1~~TRINITY_DN14383_c0_g1_i1.p2  ORF type:complete len:61 (+),score=1.95 TRINITY_DN14383_c0_g1_i1:61-243(+)
MEGQKRRKIKKARGNKAKIKEGKKEPRHRLQKRRSEERKKFKEIDPRKKQGKKIKYRDRQ